MQIIHPDRGFAMPAERRWPLPAPTAPRPWRRAARSAPGAACSSAVNREDIISSRHIRSSRADITSSRDIHPSSLAILRSSRDILRSSRAIPLSSQDIPLRAATTHPNNPDIRHSNPGILHSRAIPRRLNLDIPRRRRAMDHVPVTLRGRPRAGAEEACWYSCWLYCWRA